MENREVDPTLRPFLVSLINMALKVLLIISVAGILGIETASFVTVLGCGRD